MLNSNSSKNTLKNKSKLKKPFFSKKYCFFTKNKVEYIDYKNINMLKYFLSKPAGRIKPRFLTGTKCKYQKHLAKAIKRARFMGLLSYTSHPDDVD